MLFFGSIAKYIVILLVIAGIIGGAYFYVKTTTDTISGLQQQVTAVTIQAQGLQAANDSMRADFMRVQQHQADLDTALGDIRLQSVKASNALRTRVLNPSDPVALEKKVNQETGDALHGLEQITR